MGTALSLAVKSSLPTVFARLLTTPSNSKVESLWLDFSASKKRLLDTYDLVTNSNVSSSIDLLLRSSLSDLNGSVNCGLANPSIENAQKILQQTYWERALELTDVMYHMPTNRRNEWRESIREFKFPEFTLESVYSTLTTLLLERDKFVAERVEGVFTALSREHVTNCPQGFYKRMIINDIHNGLSPDSSRTGYINDLRIVIGRLMGREQDDRVSSYDLVSKLMKRTGEWVEMDGGSIRIRVYKKGTAHLEVHPDLAWQLNEILAMLHPRAIPSDFRTKTKKVTKAFSLSMSLLDFDVVNALGELSPVYEKCEHTNRRLKVIKNRFTPRYPYSMSKHLLAKVAEVLKSIGGVHCDHHEFQFDYDAEPIIEQVYIEGRVPDKFSHQYYPTQSGVADKMAIKFEGVEGLQLEPSAGQGALAQFMDKDATLVEVSALHCDILKQKGYDNVVCADFLKWSDSILKTSTRFGGILMNPPFSEGRSMLHLDSAVSICDNKARIVALVTQSVAKRFSPKGFTKEIEIIEAHEFKGVSVELAILTLERG